MSLVAKLSESFTLIDWSRFPDWTRQRSQAVTYVRMFVEVTTQRGVSRETLLSTAGVPAALLEDPSGRVSLQETVQVFAPDLFVAARMGRIEAGQPLWKRLAYVAITRAQERLIWVVRNRLSKPSGMLRVDDLRAAPAAPLSLETQTDDPA